MRKRRAPDLTDERIAITLETLDGWRGKLTWELLLGAVETSTGVATRGLPLLSIRKLPMRFHLRRRPCAVACRVSVVSPAMNRCEQSLRKPSATSKRLSDYKLRTNFSSSSSSRGRSMLSVRGALLTCLMLLCLSLIGIGAKSRSNYHVGSIPSVTRLLDKFCRW